MPHSQGLSNNSYPESISRIVTIFIRSFLIFSSHLRLAFLKMSFRQVYLLKFSKHCYLLPFWLHLILDLTTLTILTMKVLIVEPSPLPFSSLLGSNIRLRILFYNTLILDSSLNVRDHVSQPYSEQNYLFYKILIQAFSIIPILPYDSFPTFWQILYSG